MQAAEVFSKMILSVSGWRGVFAEDNCEESSSRNISPEHKLFAAMAARAFSQYLSAINGAFIVGRDTRPTGAAIADAIIRVLLLTGREVWYLGIAAVPEIMAFACSKANFASGFIYISASHNPIGCNGIKFGLTDGGVLQAEKNSELVSHFKSIVASSDKTAEVQVILDCAADEKLNAVYASEGKWKNEALAAYRDLSEEVISGSKDKLERANFFSTIKRSLEKQPIGIVADFNGSARAASIDRDFFGSLGADFLVFNDIPGKIAHGIVPEGEYLEPCRVFLENIHNKNPSFILGYMSDCDGDRGNLVIASGDDGKQKTRILEAQEVFALACIAELSSLVRNGELKFDKNGNVLTRAALVVNDPTSLRIDVIARIFGVSVFRAEVGEANLVGLGGKLREQGYLVRILGEGSNGGTIIHPSAVRDPINTLGAILKLLAVKSGNIPGLFEIWCRLSGQSYRADFSLADIIASLPAFFTTGAVSNDAVLRINTGDHCFLKNRYQEIFLREWEEKKTYMLEQFGFERWEAIAYNGMEEKRVFANFGEAGKGGLKIEFSGRKDKAAFIWMRGSGTEPVLRIMADAQDAGLERLLINWQRQMVLEANAVI